MGVQDNVQIVKDGYAALGRGDIRGLLASFAEGIELVIPSESRQALTEPKESAGPMAYLAVLVILAAIAALMTIFCSIGSAN